MHPFNQEGEVEAEAIEARGHKWLVCWSLGEDDACCAMTDGVVRIEIANPHEWQVLYTEAGLLLGDDEATACDLACERLKRLMQQRGK